MCLMVPGTEFIKKMSVNKYTLPGGGWNSIVFNLMKLTR